MAIVVGDVRETLGGGDMHGELWGDVLGFEGFYEVSSLGRVRSCPRVSSWTLKESGTVVMRDVRPTIITPSRDKDGYLILGLKVGGRRYNKKVHRLVAEAFIPNPEDLPQVNHKNLVRGDNKVENLEWCTCKGNLNHTSNITGHNKPGYNHHKVFTYVVALPLDGLVGYVSFGRKQLESLGFDQGAVSNVTRGRKKSHKGFKFLRRKF